MTTDRFFSGRIESIEQAREAFYRLEEFLFHASGDCDGPKGPVTDNRVARFDGTTGKLIQDSGVAITDTGRMGVGTDSPGRELHVSLSGQAAIALSDTRGAADDKTMGILVDGAQALSNRGLVIQSLSDAGAFQANIALFEDTGNVGVGTLTPAEKVDVNGAVAIVDGMTAPGATAGKAKIYVDTADGSLKVKFGDGTVKTLATNP